MGHAKDKRVEAVNRMDFSIRKILDTDAEALADFYNGLSEASKRTFRPLGVTTTAEACAKIIGENAPGIEKKLDLVAVADNAIAGWGFLWNLGADSPTFGLGVADAYQGQGLGRALTDEVLRLAIERGIRRITLTVVQDNDKARLMYERRGFVRQEAFVGEDGLPYYYMTAEPPILPEETGAAVAGDRQGVATPCLERKQL